MGHRKRLQNFIFKLQRLGFVLRNEYHVLAQLVPPIKETPYQLRQRAHNRSPPVSNTLMRKNFVTRMLYKDSY